jgi:hypothetical protein
MNYFVTDRNDEVQGPFGLEEVKKQLASGSIETTALLCEEGSETWQPLVSVVSTVPPTVPQASPAKPPERALDAPGPKKHANIVFLIGVVIGVALLFLAAYFFGRRLWGVA